MFVADAYATTKARNNELADALTKAGVKVSETAPSGVIAPGDVRIYSAAGQATGALGPHGNYTNYAGTANPLAGILKAWNPGTTPSYAATAPSPAPAAAPAATRSISSPSASNQTPTNLSVADVQAAAKDILNRMGCTSAATCQQALWNVYQYGSNSTMPAGFSVNSVGQAAERTTARVTTRLPEQPSRSTKSWRTS